VTPHEQDERRRRLKHARSVRAVIGIPLYNAVERGFLQEALDSLLAQAYRQVAFVFVDDGSTDGTCDVVSAIASRDRRVYLSRNPQRLGLVENWRHSFAIARQLFPHAPYFAWGSDHDRWNRRWLDTLVAELDAHPGAVMAYPRFTRIDANGHELKGRWPDAMRDSAPLLLNWSKIGAGKLVYGLFRADMLERAGVYPRVHEPDVYLLVELSLYGELRMVPRTLWQRRERPGHPRGSTPVRPPETRLQRLGRAVGIGRVRRQHRAVFPDGVPLYARLPSWVQHVSLLWWRLVILGNGRPQVGRRAGAGYATRLCLARLKQPVQSKKKQRVAKSAAPQRLDSSSPRHL
jgi:hypothetical protein